MSQCLLNQTVLMLDVAEASVSAGLVGVNVGRCWTGSFAMTIVLLLTWSTSTFLSKVSNIGHIMS